MRRIRSKESNKISVIMQTMHALEKCRTMIDKLFCISSSVVLHPLYSYAYKLPLSWSSLDGRAWSWTAWGGGWVLKTPLAGILSRGSVWSNEALMRPRKRFLMFYSVSTGHNLCHIILLSSTWFSNSMSSVFTRHRLGKKGEVYSSLLSEKYSH